MSDDVDRIRDVPPELRTLLAWLREEMIDNTLGEPMVAPVDEFPILGPGSSPPNVGVGGAVTVNAQVGGTSRITTVIVSLPAGGGVLQLGSRVIPFPSGVSVLSACQFDLRADDVRTLTVTNGGLAWVELQGYALVGTGPVLRTAR